MCRATTWLDAWRGSDITRRVSCQNSSRITISTEQHYWTCFSANPYRSPTTARLRVTKLNHTDAPLTLLQNWSQSSSSQMRHATISAGLGASHAHIVCENRESIRA
jgi:hypothetical protein